MNYNESNKNEYLNNFEFLLTLQNNIVCQRFFPVRNYNPKAKNSMQIYEYMKYMCNVITEDLKNKNADYMLENKATDGSVVRLVFVTKYSKVCDS
jgi:hypothetical protein